MAGPHALEDARRGHELAVVNRGSGRASSHRRVASSLRGGVTGVFPFWETYSHYVRVRVCNRYFRRNIVRPTEHAFHTETRRAYNAHFASTI